MKRDNVKRTLFDLQHWMLSFYTASPKVIIITQELKVSVCVCVCVCVCLTDKGVLVELLQVWGGLWWPVDDLAIIDVSLSEILHRRVWSVPMLDRTWRQAGRKTSLSRACPTLEYKIPHRLSDVFGSKKNLFASAHRGLELLFLILLTDNIRKLRRTTANIHISQTIHSFTAVIQSYFPILHKIILVFALK